MNFEKDKEYFLTDLESMIFNICGDYSEENASEVFRDAANILLKKAGELQNSICDNVERLVDSFGGSDCTLRQLKGE